MPDELPVKLEPELESSGSLFVPATIQVRGARVHNLRNIDLDLPRDQLVVLTGVSGSGKSSLAFDTLFAEGQRRFMETLSSYARQILDQLEPPDVDQIDGLPPTVAIDQKAGLPNPRSTVATITEVLDYLRLLFARTGTPHCPQCHQPIQRQTPEQMTSTAMALADASRVMILAPLVRGRKGEHAESFAAIGRAGLIRARVDGEILDVSESPPKLAKTKTHTIEAVIDRLVIRDGIRPRMAESIDRAIKLSDGTVILCVQQPDGTWVDRVLSVHLSCPGCGMGLEPLEPRSFSFNSPAGACPACDGLGTSDEFDLDLILPDRTLSLGEGAVAPWSVLAPADAADALDDKELTAFLKAAKVDRFTPLDAWPARTLDAFVLGQPKEKVWSKGLLQRLKHTLDRAESDKVRNSIASFQSAVACETCQGARLNAAARAVKLGGESLTNLLARPVGDALAFFQQLKFDPPADQVGPPLVQEIAQRLVFLDRVGLGYLSLDRPADSLSGGELQRVRLATQIGSGLVGVCFILDEPTAGLHPRDSERLLESLKSLRDAGNSVLVVEHDETVVRAADWVVDIGPGAGPDGGQIVAQGTLEEVERSDSVTGAWLRNELGRPDRHSDRLENSPGAIEILGASAHNLQGIDVKIPLGTIACVTGISGSGKSTLVQDVLGRAARRALQRVSPKPGKHREIRGLDQIERLVEVDQAPIGRSPRSSPATYTGLYDEIRKIFALTKEAKLRGYKPNRFSFNVKGGRCETCLGQGQRKIEMQFLPDLFVRCEACDGRRFNAPTLEIRYKGKSIADVLDMRVDESLTYFEATPKVLRAVEALHQAGLGYMTLGQSSTTLSGGEAQRVKLAAELAGSATNKTLYLLDEPTTGLHAADVQNLVRVFERLADAGNTLVVIEHNLDLIRAADWVIDLGPEGGPAGGQLMAQGPPTMIAGTAGSHTGHFLRKGLSESLPKGTKRSKRKS